MCGNTLSDHKERNDYQKSGTFVLWNIMQLLKWVGSVALNWRQSLCPGGIWQCLEKVLVSQCGQEPGKGEVLLWTGMQLTAIMLTILRWAHSPSTTENYAAQTSRVLRLKNHELDPFLLTWEISMTWTEKSKVQSSAYTSFLIWEKNYANRFNKQYCIVTCMKLQKIFLCLCA